MPVLELAADAKEMLVNYSWPGNIRQLKNITEQINVLEQDRLITAETLAYYLPHEDFGNRSMVVAGNTSTQNNFSEREILYKVLFDMKNDLNDLKKLVGGLMQSGVDFAHDAGNAELIQRVFASDNQPVVGTHNNTSTGLIRLPQTAEPIIEVEETLSLQNSERELIEKALKKHRNKRKYAAEELGISERTLYRKIKEYNLS
jgi:transcriptional regulator with PAS, ATPase and Fis domain